MVQITLAAVAPSVPDIASFAPGRNPPTAMLRRDFVEHLQWAVPVTPIKQVEVGRRHRAPSQFALPRAHQQHSLGPFAYDKVVASYSGVRLLTRQVLPLLMQHSPAVSLATNTSARFAHPSQTAIMQMLNGSEATAVAFQRSAET